MKRRTLATLLSLLLFTIIAAQCAPPAASPGEPAQKYKFAAIFPGVITDADYNTLGYLGVQSLNTDLGIEVAYSESVAPPDVDRVMREYIADGFNIIFTHGGQFVNQTVDLAKEFPDVHFIAEGDAAIADPPANLWVIDRNFHVGFYGVGALAALHTQTGKIGYLGGLTLPFSNAEVHAMQQAIADLGVAVELKTVWVGDFNDPTKARELADAMIAEDIDVIVGSLNLGMVGVFEAAKNAGKPVWVTAKYSDKSSFAPNQYLSSLIYDFAGPLKAIVQKITAGEGGGYYPLGFDTGVILQTPQHVTPEVAAKMREITGKTINGQIQVIKNVDPIQ
ncbi:MAG: BMP family protein [Caldilineales bacterium]|nr:BMP family protein [Caldilineales bacterium]